MSIKLTVSCLVLFLIVFNEKYYLGVNVFCKTNAYE